MGFRCSSVGLLAGYDDTSVEIQNEDVDDTNLHVEVRVVRPCSGCGQDQAETTLDFEIELEHECPDERGDLLATSDGGTKDGSHRPYTEHDFEQDLTERAYSANGTVEAEVYDDYESTDRNGKPIKSFRYRRHKLGATVSATVTCSRCDETLDVSQTEWNYASGFDDNGSH